MSRNSRSSNRKQQKQLQGEISLEASYSGPIPPPAALEKYEEICPGSADKIIRMAEKEQDFRVSSQTEGNKRAYSLLTRGQYFGFIIALICIVAGLYSLSLKETWCAGILFSLPAALVAMFLFKEFVKRDQPKQ